MCPMVVRGGGGGNKMLHLLHCDRVDFELHSFSTTENTKMSIK